MYMMAFTKCCSVPLYLSAIASVLVPVQTQTCLIALVVENIVLLSCDNIISTSHQPGVNCIAVGNINISVTHPLVPLSPWA